MRMTKPKEHSNTAIAETIENYAADPTRLAMACAGIE